MVELYLNNSSNERLRRALIFALILFSLSLMPAINGAEDAVYDEFVQQVVSEDEAQYNDHHAQDDGKDSLQNQQFAQESLHQQQRDQQQREEDRSAAETRARNAQIQKQREAAFAADLARASDKKKQALVRQQKSDAKIARRILQAAAAGNHYAVLGLPNNRHVVLPARRIVIVPGHVSATLPEIRLFDVSSAQIKRAYRERAKLVHPDKSRDSRAVEAFRAVEHAATVLLDAASRTAYDESVVEQRRIQFQLWKQRAFGTVQQTLSVTGQLVTTTKRFLGPVAIPILILSALIF
jgi:DnaJ domain